MPSVKPSCIEVNLPFDVNSALPVQIDHPSIRTNVTALPLEELFEPPPVSEKEPRIHTTQVGDGDEENGLLTATSATKEPPLAVEILMDSDYFEIHNDGDISTMVLTDKGKSVDPREYGGALYDPKSMIVPAGTTSTGRSEFIELVDVHRDTGENVDPEERGNGIAKYEPGPSRIDFHHHDHRENSLQKQGIPLESFEPTKPRDLHDPTLPQLPWHPKISPYRFIFFSIPLAIGTVKAVLSQKGSVTTPITLEWIFGVVIFLM
jgi:hypothetical protein